MQTEKCLNFFEIFSFQSKKQFFCVIDNKGNSEILGG